MVFLLANAQNKAASKAARTNKAKEASITPCAGWANDDIKTNSKGKSHCFICKKEDHWAKDCPTLSAMKQKQYNGVSQMNIASGEESSENKRSEIQYKGDEGLSGFQGLNNNNGMIHKTLSEYKLLYLDSCTTYNSIFITKILDHIGDIYIVMHGHYNIGTTIATQEVCYDAWKMQINEQGIGNLLSIPSIEREGYRVIYDTFKEWLVFAPDGTEIKFQRDMGCCNHRAYIDMRQSKNVIAMLQTVCANYKGYTNQESGGGNVYLGSQSPSQNGPPH